ncbi:MAG: hypothetical protein GEU82_15635 [Luteitalea sp.]|nr:hypothetical protein [Luteitalea sp.]
MLQALFHAWERRLASIAKDRVVRPFDWGLDWVPEPGDRNGAAPEAILRDWVARVMSDTDAFFTPEPTAEYRVSSRTGARDERRLTFPSALRTPHPENNTVHCRLFPAHGRAARRAGDRRTNGAGRSAGSSCRAAVVVLPQWNSEPGGHVGLCRLLAMNGMTALRLTLPYHDQRMPPELTRADYIVSANIARTLQVCRQAVLDARRAVAWLAQEGFDRIGILGSSLGSCLSLLTTAHEPLIRAQALNHISPYFADVVWRGLSTRHVREGIDGHIELDLLRHLWSPISPACYLERLRERQTLLVYARYDLTFPVDLSEELVRQFQDLTIPHEVAVLRCGHYSTGKTPFKFVDGYVLTRFLKTALLADSGRPWRPATSPLV